MIHHIYYDVRVSDELWKLLEKHDRKLQTLVLIIASFNTMVTI